VGPGRRVRGPIGQSGQEDGHIRARVTAAGTRSATAVTEPRAGRALRRRGTVGRGPKTDFAVQIQRLVLKKPFD